MTPFLRQFGDGALNVNGVPALKSGTLSLLSSIVQVGELVGSLCATIIGSYSGRRGGLVMATFLVTIGCIIQLAASGSNVHYFTGGRLVLGMGIGIISNAVPLYLGEISPSAIRGIVVGSWQLMLAIGQVIGACVDQGTKSIDNTASWRIPIGLNLIIPVFVWVFIYWIPESPRWLISKRRDEQACRNLIKINRGNPDFVAEPVLDVYKKDFEENMAQHSSWTSIFTDPVEFRKLYCVFGILAGQQIGGVQFIFSYATVIAQNLRLADPFAITIIIDVIEVVGVLVGFLLIERVGRKPLILWCSVVEIVSMLIIGGMASGPTIAPTVPPKTYGQTAIAFICIYVFAFNVSWGPLAWAMASELAVGPNRSLIMGVGTACFWIVAWAVTFTLPYLYNEVDGAGLGLKIGYIYSGGCLLAALFVYFCIGETRGRTFEEISEMFNKHVPARQWVNFKTNGQSTGALGHPPEGKASDKDGYKIEEEHVE